MSHIAELIKLKATSVSYHLPFVDNHLHETPSLSTDVYVVLQRSAERTFAVINLPRFLLSVTRSTII